MNRPWNRSVLAGVIGTVGALFGDIDVEDAQAQTTNRWNTTSSGKWETAGNWSLGVAPTNTQALILITNATTKTVTIDATTTNAANVTTLTISNLTVRGFGSGFNTLQLTNAGVATPLRILNGFTLDTNAVLLVTNSVLHIEGVSGGDFTIAGNVTNELGGQIISTNATVYISRTATQRGEFRNSGGRFLAGGVAVAFPANSQGTLTMAGGTITLSSYLEVGSLGTGTVWVTGGQLTVTGGLSLVTIAAGSGDGRMTVSNGSLLARAMVVAEVSGSQGTLTIAGGTNVLSESLALRIGYDSGATGAVWVTGGRLVVTNGPTVIGRLGDGQMTVSNGTWLAEDVFVATSGASQGGTLTVAGGTNVLSSSLSIGGSVFVTTGAVWVTGGQLVVTNDVTLIGSNRVGQMTVSNGVWLASNVVVGAATVQSLGTLTVAGGTNALVGPLRVGGVSGNTGTVWVTGGQLVITNRPDLVGIGNGFVNDGSVAINNRSSITVSNVSMIVGNVGSGSLANSGSINATSAFILGAGSGSTGSVVMTGGLLNITGGGLVVGSNGVGTVTQSGGTNQIVGAFIVGFNSLAEGAYSLSGGQLVASNNNVIVARGGGPGRLTQSGGAAALFTLTVGRDAGSQGTFTCSGGTNQILGALVVAQNAASTGAVWLSGGRLIVTNAVSFVGTRGSGQLTISNGTWLASDVLIATNAGSSGTLTVAGGTNTVLSSMILGNFPCTSTGIVNIVGGELDVTNFAGDAVLEVRNGTVTLSSGTLTANQLIITNACGHFIKTGGTLVLGSVNLSPSLDADDDGIPNSFDLDPIDPADADADPDGDGFTNLQEFQAGTSPINSASFFGITGIVKTNNDLRVTWMTGPGKTNALERSTGTANGSYSNNFAAITNIITTGTSTNVLDLGAATNGLALYYRVRLVP